MEKSKLMMIVIIAILAIMLIAVGFGFVYTINMIGKIDKPAEPDSVAISQGYDVKSAELIHLSDSIKANLLPESDGVEHLALVSMSIAVAGPTGLDKKEQKLQDEAVAELLANLQSKEIVVTSTVIKTLRKTTYSELRRADGQEILAQLIVDELQGLFNTNFIVDVFFGEFFMQ